LISKTRGLLAAGGILFALLALAAGVASTPSSAGLPVTPVPPVCPAAGAFQVIGSGTSGNDDGASTHATFRRPAGIAADRHGNLFVADEGNDLIRKIDASGTVTTVAGVRNRPGQNNGTASQATFTLPQIVAADDDDNLYVGDGFAYGAEISIRKISAAGEVTTLAGGGLKERRVYRDGSSSIVPVFDERDGQGANATFGSPAGIAIGPNGFVYVTDWGHKSIRRISPTGWVETIAGNLPGHMERTGYVDGPASNALLLEPRGTAVDREGRVYFSDANAIRRVGSDGAVTTIAGGHRAYFKVPSLFPAQADLQRMYAPGDSRDGPGVAAEFAGPRALAVDAHGDILVAQVGKPAIRRISSDGHVTTVLGPDPQLCHLVEDRESRQIAPGGVAVLPDGRIAFAAGNVVLVERIPRRDQAVR
jgi:sugar lactone lactonase YvrE